MNILDIAKKRFSVRSYLDKEIPQETLNMILEAAHVAPTAANMQPVKLLVVKSEESKQKLAKAAEIANQMIENQNDSDSAHYALSKNASQNKKYDDALAELEKAIRMNRENPLYYYDKGKILYLKRNYEEAQWNFEKACELDKNFYQSKYNLGLTYERLNQNEDAKKAFLQAIDIKNDYEKAFLELARINAKEKNKC